MKNKQGLKGAAKLLKVQLLAVIIISLLLAVTSGLNVAMSAILGGIVSALPNGYFARILFRHNGAQCASKIANSFYKGEAIKMLLTIGLFAVIFKFLNIHPLPLLMGFSVAQMMFWFAPFIFDNKRKQVRT